MVDRAAGLSSGLSASVEHVVGSDDTAAALGSGDVAVLGTPLLLALAERATVAAVADRLEPGWTSVGTRVELEHLRPSPLGARVRVRAVLTGIEGRQLRFDVMAEHPGGEVVGRAQVTRFVVDRERFAARARPS